MEKWGWGGNHATPSELTHFAALPLPNVKIS
jgi:hypothetical protein